MVKIKPMEKIVLRQVRGSLEAFLEGKKNLNWIKGTIEKSGVLYYRGMLKDVFDGLRRYNTLSRYQEIVEECKKEKWL
jgi:hypothetical protein